MTVGLPATEDATRTAPDVAPVAIGMDIGGTNLRTALVAADGTVLHRTTAPAPVLHGLGGGAGDALAEAIDAARLAAGRPDLPLGVGVAATVDHDGRLCGSPNLGAADVPLGELLARRVDVPVRVVNDASAAAWAEHLAGAGRGLADVALVTIGTGVGGGAVVGGQLLEGARGMAGEFGHVVVHDGGRQCPCGVFGCLEAYASGRAFGAIAAEALAEGRVSPALASGARVDGAAVTAAAAAGDALAIEVLTEAGRMVGVALAGIVNAMDPALLLIGGGAGTAAMPWLLPAARDAMASRVLGHRHRVLPDVLPATLGDDAGVVGAALLAVRAAS